jgi:predicted hydrocarbon binding protein
MFSGFFKRLMMVKKLHFLEGDVSIFDIESYIMPLNNLLYLREELHNKYGDEGISIMYLAGKRSSNKLASEFYEKLKLRGFESVNFWKNILELNGICKIVAIETKEGGNVKVELKSSFAKIYVENNSPKGLVDEYIAGMLCGIFNSVYSREDLVAKEVKCIACGDACCEFIIAPINELPKQ